MKKLIEAGSVKKLSEKAEWIEKFMFGLGRDY